MIKLLRFPVCAALLLFATSIDSADNAPLKKRRIAILPITSNNPRDADAQFAAELIRTELIADGVFEVIANDQVESQLKIIEKKQRIGSGSCSTKECVIDVGNALESELIFAGKLIKSSTGSILLSGRVINVVSQKEEYSASETSKSSENLEKACKTLVAKLNLWVTDAQFMREMTDQERQKEKAKLREKAQKGSNTSKTPVPAAPYSGATIMRMGAGWTAPAGSVTKTYYGNSLNFMMDFLFFHFGGIMNGREIYLHNEVRFYSASSDTLKSTGAYTDQSSMFSLSSGLSFRQFFFNAKFGTTLFLPYVTAGAKFVFLRQSSGTSYTYTEGKQNFTAIGGTAGGGIELLFGESFGLFLEVCYGYSPVGGSKENIDGISYAGGLVFKH